MVDDNAQIINEVSGSSRPIAPNRTKWLFLGFLLGVVLPAIWFLMKLFLDTHPNNHEALAYFHEYSKLRNQALKEYSKYYGPLTIDTTMESCTDRWNWVNEPWPWQEGGC